MLLYHTCVYKCILLSLIIYDIHNDYYNYIMIIIMIHMYTSSYTSIDSILKHSKMLLHNGVKFVLHPDMTTLAMYHIIPYLCTIVFTKGNASAKSD